MQFVVWNLSVEPDYRSVYAVFVHIPEHFFIIH